MGLLSLSRSKHGFWEGIIMMLLFPPYVGSALSPHEEIKTTVAMEIQSKLPLNSSRPFRTRCPLKGHGDANAWWCFERDKVCGVTETARLRPAPETRGQAFPYGRAHQNEARVAGKNSGCSEGRLRPNFLSIRRSGQLSTRNDCRKRQKRTEWIETYGRDLKTPRRGQNIFFPLNGWILKTFKVALELKVQEHKRLFSSRSNFQGYHRELKLLQRFCSLKKSWIKKEVLVDRLELIELNWSQSTK